MGKRWPARFAAKPPWTGRIQIQPPFRLLWRRSARRWTRFMTRAPRRRERFVWRRTLWRCLIRWASFRIWRRRSLRARHLPSPILTPCLKICWRHGTGSARLIMSGCSCFRFRPGLSATGRCTIFTANTAAWWNTPRFRISCAHTGWRRRMRSGFPSMSGWRGAFRSMSTARTRGRIRRTSWSERRMSGSLRPLTASWSAQRNGLRNWRPCSPIRIRSLGGSGRWSGLQTTMWRT